MEKGPLTAGELMNLKAGMRCAASRVYRDEFMPDKTCVQLWKKYFCNQLSLPIVTKQNPYFIVVAVN